MEVIVLNIHPAKTILFVERDCIKVGVHSQIF